MRSYILAYDLTTALDSHQQLIAFIKSNRHIDQWAQPFVGCILLKSNVDLATLTSSITEFFGNTQHIMAPIENVETVGRLHQNVWDWLNSPVGNILGLLNIKASGPR